MAKKQAEEEKGKKRKAEEVEKVEQTEEAEEVITESSDSEEEEQPDFAVENQESESEEAQPKKTEPQARRDRFRDYYMEMLTAEFGDDLDGLRKDKSFDEKKSLPILIRALEQGMNIFSAEERKMILEQS